MRFLLPLALALLCACQSTPTLPPLPAWQSPAEPQHPEAGQIIDLRTGKEITPEQLVDELGKAERVLVGERHDNPDHHALQRWLLQALAQRRESGSLLLEMLNPDQQKAVDQVKMTIARGESPGDLPVALRWQKGWDWELYAPVVRYALAQPYPLLSANLDRGEIADIYRREPQITGAAAAKSVQDELLDQIRVSHCNMLPESQLPAMLAVQQQRDRRMAERLGAAPEPAVLFAGAFHVRRDVGVPLHLDREQAQRTLALILAETGEKLDARQADFVWFTPGRERQDMCASLRDSRR